jgi:hypothetical protein
MNRTLKEYIKQLIEQEEIKVPYSFKEVELEVKPRKHRKEYPFEGYVEICGLKIDIENMPGSTRSGEDPDGKKWETKMKNAYGEIRGTKTVDKDALDVFIGKNANSPLVTIINQNNPDSGEFDEQKIIICCDTEKEAIDVYKEHYDKPERFYGGHFSININEFWNWCKNKENRFEKIEN